MPELRKDYLLDRYVIISPERAKRPSQFIQAEKPKSDPSTCPFCPQNEHMLPVVIDQIKAEDGHWLVRSVQNKFRAVYPEGIHKVKTDNDFFTFSSAYGFHEVIIETPNHGEELEDLPTERIVDVFDMIIRRINALNDVEGIKYVSIFKNRGSDAGASLSHSHSQLIAYNIVPKAIKEQLEKSYEHYLNEEKCAYCKIIEVEKTSHRKVFENQHFVAFTPYAARFPFELWIFPKRHTYSMTELNREELWFLAETMKHVLQRLDTLKYPPFNMLYINADKKSSHFHFHIEICPRLATWAGFELLNETIIDSIPPEEAAKFYRGDV